MVEDIRSDIPSLKHVIILGDEVPEGCVSLNEMAEHPYEEEHAISELETRKLDAVDDVGFLSHTTGTTGLPKVIENRIASRSIWASKNHIKKWQLTSDDVIVTIAPLQGKLSLVPSTLHSPFGPCVHVAVRCREQGEGGEKDEGKNAHGDLGNGSGHESAMLMPAFAHSTARYIGAAIAGLRQKCRDRVAKVGQTRHRCGMSRKVTARAAPIGRQRVGRFGAESPIMTF